MKCHSRNTFILRSHFHHIAFAECLTPSSAHYVLQYLPHAYVDVLTLCHQRQRLHAPTIYTPDEEEVESRVRNIHFLRKKQTPNAMQIQTCFTCNKLNAKSWANRFYAPVPFALTYMRMLSMDVSAFQVLPFFQMGKCARNSPRQHKTQKGKNENITSWFRVIEVRYTWCPCLIALDCRFAFLSFFSSRRTSDG